MTDQLTTRLTNHNAITRADSWPTGMHNDGPEEYGINYDDTLIATDTVIEQVNDLILEQSSPGFVLEHNRLYGDSVYDLGITVYYHPLAHVLTDFFETADTVTSFGLSWETDDAWADYDPDKTIAEINIDPLEVWFETTTNDYDSVLDALESTLATADFEGNTEHVTVEVYNADSDHCHIGLEYTLK